MAAASRAAAPAQLGADYWPRLSREQTSEALSARAARCRRGSPWGGRAAAGGGVLAAAETLVERVEERATQQPQTQQPRRCRRCWWRASGHSSSSSPQDGSGRARMAGCRLPLHPHRHQCRHLCFHASLHLPLRLPPPPLRCGRFPRCCAPPALQDLFPLRVHAGAQRGRGCFRSHQSHRCSPRQQEQQQERGQRLGCSRGGRLRRAQEAQKYRNVRAPSSGMQPERGFEEERRAEAAVGRVEGAAP
jgi:hypothetical protein